MIKIYSTPTCSYCNIAKKYLRDKGIKFTDYNVAVDRRRAEEMVHKTRQQGVPVIDFNGKVIIGFDKTQLDREIARLN